MLFHREGRGLLGADDQNVIGHRGRYLCAGWPDRKEGERGKDEPEDRAKTQPGDSREKRLQHFLHSRTAYVRSGSPARQGRTERNQKDYAADNGGANTPKLISSTRASPTSVTVSGESTTGNPMSATL